MKHLIIIVLFIAGSCVEAFADTVPASALLSPLVFRHYQPADSDTLAASALKSASGLDSDTQWIDNAVAERQRAKVNRYRAIVSHPDLVAYNTATMPELPHDITVRADPSSHLLPIKSDVTDSPDAPIDRRDVKLHNWLHTFDANLHFTQAYISSNWYQGGENNFNVLGELKWECNLNTNLHPKWLFNNMFHYKAGISTSHADSLRNYTFNEDILEFSSQLGYKAVKHWYYSANLLFKTQIFNNYKSNTNTMTAAWLSPGELTLGLGMTYDRKDADGIRAITVSIAPLSYNLKICRNIDDIDPTTFGIDAGHHTKHNFGSSVEGKMTWKLTPNIAWTTRLYAFTNYHYVQGDWENTFDFSINRYLSTKIFTHLRYDKSHIWHHDWRYWQFKEVLSFGLTYHFASVTL